MTSPRIDLGLLWFPGTEVADDHEKKHSQQDNDEYNGQEAANGIAGFIHVEEYRLEHNGGS